MTITRLLSHVLLIEQPEAHIIIRLFLSLLISAFATQADLLTFSSFFSSAFSSFFSSATAVPAAGAAAPAPPDGTYVSAQHEAIYSIESSTYRC